VNRLPIIAPAPIAALAVFVSLLPATAPAAASGAKSGLVSARKHAKHKHKVKRKKAKAAGPALAVIGFGINRLYVPKGAKVSSVKQCDEIVGATGSSQTGAPQSSYLFAYLRATDIPAEATSQVADSLPEADGVIDQSSLSSPAPWSATFTAGRFSFGAPGAATKHVFRTLIVGSSSEVGTDQGLAAEEFNGTYSFTTRASFGGRTLTATGKVTIACS
jgi:hypothetical protein